jgi:hypothetical protein
MSKHGWVTPLPNGAVARCGGPGICAHCKAERIVARGCPSLPGGRCWYCLAVLASTVASEVKDHQPDCMWLPFRKAYS